MDAALLCIFAVTLYSLSPWPSLSSGCASGTALVRTDAR